MFWHYHVILGQLVINTLRGYTNISNAAVGNTMKHLNYKLYYQQLHLKYLCNLSRYWLQAPWGWYDSVETCRSVIICEIIVQLLVMVQNKKNICWYFVVSHKCVLETLYRHHANEECGFGNFRTRRTAVTCIVVKFLWKWNRVLVFFGSYFGFVTPCSYSLWLTLN
jgi:hypothetical protein